MNREDSRKKRDYLFFACAGFLFVFFQMTGRELAVKGNIVWSAGFVIRLLFLCLFGGCITGILTGLAVQNRDRFKVLSQILRGRSAQEAGVKKIWRVWLVSWSLIVICWLPAYLAYYPGICAYDVTIQTGQVVEKAYNDHHPLAHTLLLGGSMKLGESLFGSVNTGIALMVLIQLLLLAGVFAWGITVLAKQGLSVRVLLCMQILCMGYPFHSYMSISVIKDVIFTIFFLVQMLTMYLVIGSRENRRNRYGIVLCASGIGMQLFRTNGRYAMLVLFSVLVLAFIFGRESRRLWGRLTINCLLALLAGSLILSALFRVTKAGQGDRREMLSMPIQQLARCMVYHGGIGVVPEDDNTMEERDKALINDFLLDESYREYRPEISDPVKRHTNTYVVRYRTADFAKTYLRLFGQYPGDFVNAALAVNAGYLYLGDVSHAHVNENGRDKGLGYVQTRWVDAELNPRGIYKDSKWNGLHEVLEKWADDNGYLRIPVLKYLFVPATFLWLYVLLAGVLLLRKKYALCIPLALVLGYYLTLFLGPVVQLRYLYPLMAALPFAAGMSLTDKN